MTMFSNLTSADNMEKAEDRLGGYQPLSSDVYDGTIKAMYAGQSESGAQNITLLVDVNGQEYRETIYFTNKKGENFYTKNGKNFPLPGFTTIDHICLVATGSPLSEQDTEDKVVKVYDYEAKTEINKTVPMLTGCLGQTVAFAILRQIENKRQNVNGEYVAIAESVTTNAIDKVFDPESRMTVVEAQNGAEQAAFHDAWLEKNQGNDRDRRTVKDGDNGNAGRPGAAANSNAGAAQNTGRKSLFGNKAA